MSTLTTAETDRIRDRLATHHLSRGLGTAEDACSITSLNLALTGTLTDDIPACMSEVIGRWISVTQDRISDEARNADRWKTALVLAAGTGRERERKRLDIILDWMWERLALVQPVADQHGYGEAWATMLRGRTEAAAANAAAYAANAAAYATNAAGAAAAYAANAADAAAYAASDAADAAADVATAAGAAASAAADAAADAVAAVAADAADVATAAADESATALLERLVTT